MSLFSYDTVRKLEVADNVNSFDCGQPALNQFLLRFALTSQKANSSQTYVCGQSGNVVGFYTLVVGSVEPATAAGRVVKGLARHPVPVMILARLAVDRNHHGGGLGRALLKDAMLRTLQAADIAGIRAMLIHAKDDAARNWYLRWGFEPSPTDPYHLFLLLKDLAQLVKP